MPAKKDRNALLQELAEVIYPPVVFDYTIREAAKICSDRELAQMAAMGITQHTPQEVFEFYLKMIHKVLSYEEMLPMAMNLGDKLTDEQLEEAISFFKTNGGKKLVLSQAVWQLNLGNYVTEKMTNDLEKALEDTAREMKTPKN